MPREWYDLHSVNTMEDGEKKDLYRKIVAEKKPYFMRYIYPDLKKQYNQFIKNTNRNSLREFRMTVPELMSVPREERTDRQKEFIKYYEYRIPVGGGDCVMNRICRRFEEEFDGYLGKHNKERQFDYTIMKSDAEYTATQFKRIKSLYEDYNRLVKSYTVFVNYERIDKFEAAAELSAMGEEFRRECDEICQNKYSLCNIVLDLCYSRNATKRFAWDMCGDEIIHNLLEKSNNTISIPVRDDNGDITYCGDKFSLIKVGGMHE